MSDSSAGIEQNGKSGGDASAGAGAGASSGASARTGLPVSFVGSSVTS